MFQLVSPNANFDFMGKQKLFITLSLLAMIASVALIVIVKPNYGIDFKGGSDIIVHFEQPVEPDQVRRAAAEAGLEDASVQRFGSEEKNQFLVQTSAVSVVDEEGAERIKAALAPLGAVERENNWSVDQPDRYDVRFAAPVEEAKIAQAVEALGYREIEVERSTATAEPDYVVRFQDLGDRVREGFEAALPEQFNEETGLDRLETVGARVGDQLREDGLTAVLLALIAILIYVALRFDLRYAPGAVLALAHDVLIAIGIVTALQMEINLPILASLLTIVGYSLNDTIVIFDRIRENYTSGRGGSTLREIANASINETLGRTLITSFTTFLAVLMIYWLGSGLISDFAFTLIVGVIAGTYSTIFIASPVLIVMDNWVRNQQEARALREARANPSPDIVDS